MSRQAAIRSALNCARNRFPLFGSFSSTSISSPCTSNAQTSISQTSALHTSAFPPSLNGLGKPISVSVSEKKFTMSNSNSVSPVVLSAQLSTAEANEGESVGSASSLEDSDSVDDADGRSTVSPTFNMEVPPGKLQPGHATPEGTARFAARFLNYAGSGHFREFDAGMSWGTLSLPSIGVGEYRGKELHSYDRQFVNLVKEALLKGVNLFDLSHLMRGSHCERVVGHVLSHLVETNQVSREEVVICTKGGMIPRETIVSKEYSMQYLNKFVDQGLFELEDVAAPQCMKPAFLEHQLNQSRKNLGVETVDVYYIQNIECQMNKLEDRPKFYSMLKDAFTFLEASCEEKKVKVYGITARAENFLNPKVINYISLEKIVEQAKEIGGEHHRLKFFQLPLNIASIEGMDAKSQCVDGEWMSTVDAANKLGLYVVAQATDFFSKTYRGLPEKRNYNPEIVKAQSDAVKCLHFSRTFNGVGTALVTTRRPLASNVMLSCVPLDC